MANRARDSNQALRRTIYLSSTFADLARPRAAVAKAIERLHGHAVVGMEGYLAADQRPVDRCLADVATCDYYIGVFAWRYGFVPAGESRSITELELREAIASRKPRLLFVLDERAAWPTAHRDADATRIAALRSEVLQTHLVSVFRNVAELPLLAAIAVANQTMQELRGVREVAHAALRAGVARIEQVLFFLAWLPHTAATGTELRNPPSYLAHTGPSERPDLRDSRLVDALCATSISPPRKLNGPYAAPSPSAPTVAWSTRSSRASRSQALACSRRRARNTRPLNSALPPSMPARPCFVTASCATWRTSRRPRPTAATWKIASSSLCRSSIRASPAVRVPTISLSSMRSTR